MADENQFERQLACQNDLSQLQNKHIAGSLSAQDIPIDGMENDQSASMEIQGSQPLQSRIATRQTEQDNRRFSDAIQAFASRPRISNPSLLEGRTSHHYSGTIISTERKQYDVRPPPGNKLVLQAKLREISRGSRAPDGSYIVYRPQSSAQSNPSTPSAQKNDEQASPSLNTPMGKSKQTHRLGPPETKSEKPKAVLDYTSAIPFPKDHAKKEDDKCLTCIRYNRVCIGTKLSRVDARGRISWRCFTCTKEGGKGARSGRNCLWADPANGIFTYEDAQKDKKAIINWKNSTEGRAARVQARAGDAAAQEMYAQRGSSVGATRPAASSSTPVTTVKISNGGYHHPDTQPQPGRWAWIPASEDGGDTNMVDVQDVPSMPAETPRDHHFSANISQESEYSEDESLEVQIWRAWNDLQETARTTLESAGSKTSRSRLYLVMHNQLCSGYEYTRREIREGLEACVKAYGRDVMASIGLGAE